MKLINKKDIKNKLKNLKRNKQIYLILEDLSYARNVASIFRTANAGGVERIYLSGITAKPPFGKELRQVSRSKERSLEWQELESSENEIQKLRNIGFFIIGIDLTDEAENIKNLAETAFKKDKICIVLGNEVHGIKKTTLKYCDKVYFIPTFTKGSKGLNISVTAGVVLYSF